MQVLVGVLLLIVVLLLAAVLLGAIALNLIYYLLVGLVVGALARVIVPGTGGMGLLATALYGIAGALLGGLIAGEVFNLGTLGAVIVSVIVAALLIAAIRAIDARGSAGRTSS